MTPIIAIRTALRFLTRIPIPGPHADSEAEFAWSVAWYPAVGILIGSIGALLSLVCSGIGLPSSFSAILIWGFLIVMTGALHEDGFADTADAIGGGSSIQKRLEIMKDSRIGTFGGIALIALLSWRFATLNNLDMAYWPSVLILSQSLSRLTPLIILYWLPYAREEDKGIATPFISGLNWHHIALAWISMCPLILWDPPRILILLLGIATCGIFWGLYCRSKVNGITGDLAGASIIIGEFWLLGYLCLS